MGEGWIQGFEPWASRATIWRANQLRYTHHRDVIVPFRALTSLAGTRMCSKGFEPPTHGLEGRCSIQLSYRHMLSSQRSGWWESNPRIQLGRLVFYHWTTPAQLVVCASLSHQRRLVYMMKLYLSTLNLNFFYFFNNIYKSSSDKQFVTQIKSSVSLLSSIPNNCYAVYQKELSLLLI